MPCMDNVAKTTRNVAVAGEVEYLVRFPISYREVTVKESCLACSASGDYPPEIS